MPTVKSYQKQREKEKIAYDYFLNQGYSAEATSGIVGNLVYESGLNTSAEGDIGYKGGSSFGIAQFRGKRLENLKKRYGKAWTDFGNQLEFVKHELETTHKKAGNILKNTRDVYEAGQAFSDFYEIPAKKYKNNADRQKKVNTIYKNFTGNKIISDLPTPIFDQAIRQANEYFSYSPTTDLTNLPNSNESVNFVEEDEKEEVSKDPDIEQVKQQTKEYNFLEEYKNIVNQQPQQEIIQQEVQQNPQQNLTDIYNEVSQFIDTPVAQEGVIKDNEGYWNPDNWGKVVEIDSPYITMEGVFKPLIGISNETGEKKLMTTNKNYHFKNTQHVTEYPIKDNEEKFLKYIAKIR